MRIIVIGCPGSGKSYFSKRLGKKLNYNIYYLDVLYWKPNWVPCSREEFQEKLDKIYKEDNFIIDGNYQSTLAERFNIVDKIFFLDIPEEICIKQEAKRRGSKRDDLPDYLVEEYDPEFIEYIKNFKNDGRVIIQELISQYKDKKEIIIFKNKDEIEQYLNNI